MKFPEIYKLMMEKITERKYTNIQIERKTTDVGTSYGRNPSFGDLKKRRKKKKESFFFQPLAKINAKMCSYMRITL